MLFAHFAGATNDMAGALLAAGERQTVRKILFWASKNQELEQRWASLARGAPLRTEGKKHVLQTHSRRETQIYFLATRESTCERH